MGSKVIQDREGKDEEKHISNEKRPPWNIGSTSRLTNTIFSNLQI